MTEAEWLTSSEPEAMLQLLKGAASHRKLRLFAVACCRRVLDLLTPASRQVLEVAERLADGQVGGVERKLARASALAAGWVMDGPVQHARGPAKASVCDALRRGAHDAAVHAAWRTVAAGTAWGWNRLRRGGGAGEDWQATWAALRVAELATHADLVRDIFGNPFRPAVLDPPWVIPAVASLAQAIYADHAFARMPELADALAAAGCADADVLAHCRGPGPHVRGCWVVDLILGKA
jgi:hypothetical protein